MIIKTLYTGNGVSLSPQNAEGRTVSSYVRLVADDGRAITDGNIVTTCVDVIVDNVGLWSDCELLPVPEDDELSAEEALEIITGGAT